MAAGCLKPELRVCSEARRTAREDNYLRWDSLGEFMALAPSLSTSLRQAATHAALMAKCLDDATTRFLDEDKKPDASLGGIDNRGSHFYLCRFWRSVDRPIGRRCPG